MRHSKTAWLFGSAAEGYISFWTRYPCLKVTLGRWQWWCLGKIPSFLGILVWFAFITHQQGSTLYSTATGRQKCCSMESFFVQKEKNVLEVKEIDFLMRSGILCCREILFDSLLPQCFWTHKRKHLRSHFSTAGKKGQVSQIFLITVNPGPW